MRLPIVLLLMASNSALAGHHKVAVIDGSVDTFMVSKAGIAHCKQSHKVSTDHLVKGFSYQHGTNIALTSMEGIKDACLLTYSVFVDTKDGKTYPISPEIFSQSIRQAVKDGATIINYSISGRALVDSERLAMLYALVRGVTINVAVGNDGEVLTSSCKDIPACYSFRNSFAPYVLSGKFNMIGNWNKTSNKISGMKFMPFCSSLGFEVCGSSQSTALYTNRLLKGK